MFVRFLNTLLIVIAAIAVFSCAAPPRNDGHSIGIALDMLIEQDDSAALYRVAADGSIAFAGGYDARMRRFTWTGDLHPAEVESLRAVLNAPFWRENRRDGGRLDPGERRTTVTVHQPLRSRVIIRGEQPEAIRQLEGMLKEAASRRFEADLDALPKPGPRQ